MRAKNGPLRVGMDSGRVESLEGNHKFVRGIKYRQVGNFGMEWRRGSERIRLLCGVRLPKGVIYPTRLRKAHSQEPKGKKIYIRLATPHVFSFPIFL